MYVTMSLRVHTEASISSAVANFSWTRMRMAEAHAHVPFWANLLSTAFWVDLAIELAMIEIAHASYTVSVVFCYWRERDH